MGKNVLIFSDGTGQAGGRRPDELLSNVYKMFRASRPGPDSPIDPAEQVAFYDAGLGTDADAEHAFAWGRRLRKLWSSATGWGISKNIAECYAAILKHYNPGDRIYLVGFSRGAYTVRAVAQLLGLCGVPTRDPETGGPLRRSPERLKRVAAEAVRDVYEHGAGRDRSTFDAQRTEKARRFREKYASANGDRSNAVPYFIGVFDTVAALGASLGRRLLVLGVPLLVIGAVVAWLGSALGFSILATSVAMLGAVIAGVLLVLGTRIRTIRDFPSKGQSHSHLSAWFAEHYDRGLPDGVQYVRHAMAIDEERADFARVEWGGRTQAGPARDDSEPQWFVQLWFPGCHSDVGGSYSEDESRLSDVALGWMVDEAKALKHPITFDPNKLHIFPSAVAPQHCEIEHVLARYPTWFSPRLRLGWKRKLRKHPLGAPWHPSVEERFSAPFVLHCGRPVPYRPAALAADERVRHYYEGAPNDPAR